MMMMNNNGTFEQRMNPPDGGPIRMQSLNDDDIKLVGSRLYVGNINDKITRNIIENRFSKYGRVIGVTMHEDCCYVQYEDDKVGQLAIKGEHRSIMFGNKLEVRMERDQRMNQENIAIGQEDKSLFIPPDSPSERRRSPSITGRRDQSRERSRDGSLYNRPSYRDRSPLRGSRDAYDSKGLYRRERENRSVDDGPRDRDRPSLHKFRDRLDDDADRGRSSGVNDCELIVTNRSLRSYAQLVERKLRKAGLRNMDIIFSRDDNTVVRLIKDISSRGCLYAIIIQTQNEVHNSITLNILHGTPQEHRNMPLKDAMKFIKINFDMHTRELAAKKIAEKVRGIIADSDTVDPSYAAPQPPALNLNIHPQQQQMNNRPLQQMDNRPQQQMDNRPQQQMDNRPQHQMDNRPQQQMDNRPQQRMDNRPQQQINNRPQEQLFNRPQQQTNNPPLQQINSRPQQQQQLLNKEPLQQFNNQPQQRLSSHAGVRSSENDVQTLLQILADGKQLTVMELDRVIKHLEESRNKLIASNSGTTYSSDPAHPRQHLELQQKIKSLFGGPASNSDSNIPIMDNTGDQGISLYNSREDIEIINDESNGKSRRRKGGEGRWGPPINTETSAASSSASALNINLENPNIQKALDNLLQSGPNILKCLDMPEDRDRAHPRNSSHVGQPPLDRPYSGGMSSRNMDLDSRNIPLLSTPTNQEMLYMANQRDLDSRNRMQMERSFNQDSRNLRMNTRDMDSRLRDIDSRNIGMVSTDIDFDHYNRGLNPQHDRFLGDNIGQGNINPNIMRDVDRYDFLHAQGRSYQEPGQYNQRQMPPFY